MRSIEKLTRHQVLLYPGDFERLSRMTRNGSASALIRELVRKYIEATDIMMERDAGARRLARIDTADEERT